MVIAELPTFKILMWPVDMMDLIQSFEVMFGLKPTFAVWGLVAIVIRNDRTGSGAQRKLFCAQSVMRQFDSLSSKTIVAAITIELTAWGLSGSCSTVDSWIRFRSLESQPIYLISKPFWKPAHIPVEWGENLMCESITLGALKAAAFVNWVGLKVNTELHWACQSDAISITANYVLMWRVR